MEHSLARVVLAGTHSGCGKTTVTCAVLQALVDRGLKLSAFKCGPDYIDPMFHRAVIGVPSANLDLFLFPQNTLKQLLLQNAADCALGVIEGVMGFYDGIGLTGTAASTYETARVTQSPVVLVVDAKGAALSVLATIQGFLDFFPDSGIRGVILNRCSAPTYSALAEGIRTRFSGRVRPLGFLPVTRECSLESRHLGLIPAQEVRDLKEKLQALARQAERTLDLDGLLALAQTAPTLACQPVAWPRLERVRIAVARDAAFCFYYEDSLGALREMGAQLVPFSPLSDRALPPDIHGLYLGGGYPELHARRLSENAGMRRSVKAALDRGLACIAECGGFLYLNQTLAGFPMVGFLPGGGFDTGRLTRFGYVRLRANRDSMLCPADGELPAHEFHHWDSDSTGDAFTARKSSGAQWECVHATDRLYAGFPHLHFYARPDAAVRFYNTCLKEKYRHDAAPLPHGH